MSYTLSLADTMQADQMPMLSTSSSVLLKNSIEQKPLKLCNGLDSPEDVVRISLSFE